jgi:hypothetical protein
MSSIAAYFVKGKGLAIMLLVGAIVGLGIGAMTESLTEDLLPRRP